MGVAAIAALAVVAALSQPAAAAPCDRACLKSMIDQYVSALIAHDPSHLPVAADVKFTENLVPLKFGEQGLWKTADGRRDFNIYALDPARGDAVWIGIIRENGKAVMVAFRLKVEDQKITEVETLVGRSLLTAAETVPGPRPDFAEIVPPAQRSDRDKLIAIADSNWDAMEHGDGSLAPYAVDCERYDNGHKTTNGPSPGPHAKDAPPAAAPNAANADIGDLGCFGQMNSGRFNNGNKVDPRRIWAVDQEHGLVVGLFMPNVPGNVKQLTLRNGKPVTMGPDELIPFSIAQVEMFKIANGEIHRVEVVLGPRVPYGMRSSFDMETLWKER